MSNGQLIAWFFIAIGFLSALAGLGILIASFVLEFRDRVARRAGLERPDAPRHTDAALGSAPGPRAAHLHVRFDPPPPDVLAHAIQRAARHGGARR